MARRLAQAGVLQDGDVALTFRPELAGTMPYPHIQMGTTHAGLIYTRDSEAYNIDSPLDTSYLGQFDAPHYAGDGDLDAGTDALHILRPRVMNEQRRAQLREWVATLTGNLPRINGQRAQVKFQQNYLEPSYAANDLTTRQIVTKLGQIILEADTTTRLPMYCSELAWHLIALSNCGLDEIREAPQEGAACVDEPFAPMPIVATSEGEIGLAEGPLYSLLEAPADQRPGLAAAIFATGSAARLSSGHRMVAEQVAPLMEGLAGFYQARAAGAPVDHTAPAAAMLTAQVTNNYSPTAFLVAAMADSRDRRIDYVATIAFVNAAGLEKARRLARNEVP
jgi:hypothetical protein